MYPETDVPPVRITKKLLDKIKIPGLISEKIDDYEKKYNISKEKIKALMKAKAFGKTKLDLFKEIAEKNKNIKPAFICEAMLAYDSEIDAPKLKKTDILDIFDKLDKGEITKSSVIPLIVDTAKGKVDFEKYSVEKIDLEKEIKKIINSKKGLSIGAYMGLIMGKFKGKVDGKKAMEILKKQV